MAGISAAGTASEHDIPWTLVRTEDGGRALVLRYSTVLAPGVDVRLKPAEVKMTPEALAITLTEVVRTEEGDGLIGVYFDTRETRILLDEPLGARAVTVGHVDEDMDAYREVLRSADEEAQRLGQ